MLTKTFIDEKVRTTAAQQAEQRKNTEVNVSLPFLNLQESKYHTPVFQEFTRLLGFAPVTKLLEQFYGKKAAPSVAPNPISATQKKPAMAGPTENAVVDHLKDNWGPSSRRR